MFLEHTLLNYQKKSSIISDHLLSSLLSLRLNKGQTIDETMKKHYVLDLKKFFLPEQLLFLLCG